MTTPDWPAFITHDLGDTEQDEQERILRWETYRKDMDALIATGDYEKDADGWWFHLQTGQLVGPDPEIERPLRDQEVMHIRARGRPKSDNPKVPVSIRLDRDVLEHFKKDGKGWQSRVNAALREKAGI